MSSKALVKRLKMRPEVIACLLYERRGGLLVLYCAVLRTINLLNSLVGGAEKSECDNAVPRADRRGDRTAV